MIDSPELNALIRENGLAWVLVVLRNAANKRKRAKEAKAGRLPSDAKFNSIIRDLAPDAIQRIKATLKA